MLLSADDDPGQATPELIDLALKAVNEARGAELSDLTKRMTAGVPYPDIWPGEHYKLLAGIVKLCDPKLIVEIGTATGLSALAMLKYLPLGSRLMTFDLIGWRDYPDHVLCEEDFSDGRLTQHLADLSDPQVFAKYRHEMQNAELIFVDAAKDGVQEERFLQNFERCPFRSRTLIVFDDIRLWNMLRIWRQITRPKLDLTSFGHWSGTGLVLWNPPR